MIVATDRQDHPVGANLREPSITARDPPQLAGRGADSVQNKPDAGADRNGIAVRRERYTANMVPCKGFEGFEVAPPLACARVVQYYLESCPGARKVVRYGDLGVIG